MSDDDSLDMWTIYNRPRDVPDRYVARLWRIRRGHDPAPTQTAIYDEDLEKLRSYLRGKGLTRLPRSEFDDPVIVETWL